jgi:protoporphyrinogen oxidase
MKGESSAADLVVVGAGPSGLSIASQAIRRGYSTEVLEGEAKVGGLAKSLDVDGFRLDHIAHRWVPKSRLVRETLDDLLGDDLCRRLRCHVIRLDGRYFGHPFSLPEYMSSLPAPARLRIGADVMIHRLRQRVRGRPRTFADHAISNFGGSVYRIYFEPHYEKTTGVSPAELLASYAERFSGSSTPQVLRAVLGVPPEPPPEREFFYPRLGSGQVWERLAERVQSQGVGLRTASPVVEVERAPHGCLVRAVDGAGGQFEIRCRKLVSTAPLTDLVAMIRPAAEPRLLEMARSLRRLRLVIVYLLIRRPRFLPYDAIYFPAPQYDFSILEDFSYLSQDMSPSGCSAVCAALTDWDGRYWDQPDAELARLVRQQMAAAGFPIADDEYLGSHVARVANARPDPGTSSREKVAELLDFVNRDGVLSVGRQGTLTPLMTMDASVELGQRLIDTLAL